MLKSNDGEDIFYDSVDSFRSCDSLSLDKSATGGGLELDYRIWNSQPVSVVERREKFLQGMGFTEFVPPQLRRSQEINEFEFLSSDVSKRNNLESDRIAECGGAVSSSCTSAAFRREGVTSCSGRSMVRQSEFVAPQVAQRRSCKQRPSYISDKVVLKLPEAQQFLQREATAHVEDVEEFIKCSKKIKRWWSQFTQTMEKERKQKLGGSIRDHDKTPKANRMKVKHNRKRCKEFTAVYMGQEIQAHKGFIWTMKFSPDGKYLASGGEDGVVRIWRVTSIDPSCKNLTTIDTSKLSDQGKGRTLILGRKKTEPTAVIIPQKVFKIDELPLHEFHGHTDDVLDLCWSKSNCLLSSSKDGTVRLWQVGSNECRQIFHHNNYVTCIQFNPVNDEYFISGSIDGKVRVWGVLESRVVDWADVRDIITAICYQPDGQGFVVGTISGHCRFYDASSNNLQLDAQFCVQGKKRSSGNRINGFQFSPEDARKLVITSSDSKVRIFDGLDLIHKYRGLRKSGSQMSASFTSSGRHIISIGEDSRVYVWNYDGLSVTSSKQTKSIRSCEHFFFEGVSVAIPWLGMETRMDSSLKSSSQKINHLKTSSLPRDSGRFSLGGWFSMDGRLRGLATWPEERLPLWSVPVEDEDDRHLHHHDHHDEQEQDHHYHQDHQDKHQVHNNGASLSSTWGLVIVTGGWDGVIRTFHNYGLPVRL